MKMMASTARDTKLAQRRPNRSTRTTKAIGLGAAFMLVASLAVAQDKEDDSGVSQKLSHGEINWSGKTVTATGSGAPSGKEANVAMARLGA